MTDPDSVDRDRLPRAGLIDEHRRTRDAIEEFAHGEIRSYHGIVNRWLLAVYAILAAWGVYYLVKYWGGLGPGLAR
jgi:hypothetical protein